MSMYSIVSIGGNMDNTLTKFKALKKYFVKNNIIIIKFSNIYYTKPWGKFDDNDINNFYNQILIINCNLKPQLLLKFFKKIEKKMGRLEKKTNNYENRIIDVDILFFGNHIVNNSNLIIPHSFISNRNFILTPLNDILPKYNHPVFNKKISELLKECTDDNEVILYKK